MTGPARAQFYTAAETPRIMAEACRNPPSPSDRLYLAIALTSAAFDHDEPLRSKMHYHAGTTDRHLDLLQDHGRAAAGANTFRHMDHSIDKSLSLMSARLTNLGINLQSHSAIAKHDRVRVLGTLKAAAAFIDQFGPGEPVVGGGYRANPFIALHATAEILHFFDASLKRQSGTALTVDPAHRPLDNLPSFLSDVHGLGGLHQHPSKIRPEALYAACVSLSVVETGLRGVIGDSKSGVRVLPEPVMIGLETLANYLVPYAGVKPEKPRERGYVAEIVAPAFGVRRQQSRALVPA